MEIIKIRIKLMLNKLFIFYLNLNICNFESKNINAIN